MFFFQLFFFQKVLIDIVECKKIGSGQKLFQFLGCVSFCELRYICDFLFCMRGSVNIDILFFQETNFL